jgi:lipoyl(octanoyl) transferase
VILPWLRTKSLFVKRFIEMRVIDLGSVDYESTVEAMRAFTAQRNADTEDELWLLEHPQVFTLGQNGNDEHVLNTQGIPLVSTDRGGQVTYHGPGQLIVYTLIDLKRAKIGVRDMVTFIENSIIELLAELDIKAQARKDAPGVYVAGQKIAALGLRVKRGACYHGLSLNVAMDLAPFSYINPCGYQGMQVVDIKSLGVSVTMQRVKSLLVTALNKRLQQGNK